MISLLLLTGLVQAQSYEELYSASSFPPGEYLYDDEGWEAGYPYDYWY